MADVTILEPMSTGDVIDRAVRLYRRNFTPLVSISAVPSVLGYIVSLLFWSGLGELERGRGMTPGAVVFMALGAIGYPIWLFVLLMTIAGLSRVVGDHVMLEESITFRKCASAIRRRFKDILLMALLSLVAVVAIYMAVSAIIFVLILIVGIVAGVFAAAGMPPTVIGLLVGFVAIVAIAAAIFLILVILVRITFLPQVVMLEGQSAGNALTRAINLGKGNWHRFGAIVLFGYFVSLSMLAALLLPVLALLQLSGQATSEFFSGQGWNAIYGACNQIASLLVLPIWIISITLLYFDSRVRKEAYDLELLAREIAPGFYWQPPVQTSAFGYQMAAPAGDGRAFTQTSPLGLAGYGRQTGFAGHAPPGEHPEASEAASRVDEPVESRRANGIESSQEAVGSSGALAPQAWAPGDAEGSETPREAGGAASPTCWKCGAGLDAAGRFCGNCGAAFSPSPL
ncbi:MAG TPA: zinc ribbon domain-containing protein [Blastocatellia bacterium]|jgi:hypothetical protein|nr:zinc ribbon domain-containing protein [Blastocatellia bacterium]